MAPSFIIDPAFENSETLAREVALDVDAGGTPRTESYGGSDVAAAITVLSGMHGQKNDWIVKGHPPDDYPPPPPPPPPPSTSKSQIYILTNSMNSESFRFY
ncbi:hypothetical protein COLO4_19969 [Corchorus olitorius]|uniref:Uncharacterized protein n=1 Tax=Corchorus olitorius TaxID=93759 RepID=A0A1R3J2G4_9ROSI|nr:hypothetical protein COLO4_19969 [Corchorus olitorius]